MNTHLDFNEQQKKPCLLFWPSTVCSYSFSLPYLHAFVKDLKIKSDSKAIERYAGQQPHFLFPSSATVSDIRNFLACGELLALVPRGWEADDGPNRKGITRNTSSVDWLVGRG